MPKINNSFPASKKNIRNFLTEEEGKIAKKDMAKLGLFIIASSVAAAGVMKARDAGATCSHANHGSHGSHGSHGNHSNHYSSHGSHGAHNSGW